MLYLNKSGLPRRKGMVAIPNCFCVTSAHPTISIQTAVLYGFGKMFYLYVLTSGKVAGSIIQFALKAPKTFACRISGEPTLYWRAYKVQTNETRVITITTKLDRGQYFP